MEFYENVVGLELGTFDANRRIAFYWVGGRNVSMLGLWEKPNETIVSQHFAFQIPESDFPKAIDNLKRNNVVVYNFLDDGTSEPMVFCWAPAVSIYFRDPDGHELEYIAPLHGSPVPEAGIVSIERWNQINSGGKY